LGEGDGPGATTDKPKSKTTTVKPKTKK